MDLLVFNCGSSSQGFTVFRSDGSGEPQVIASGKARNVAAKTKAASVLEWNIGREKGSLIADLSTHRLAAGLILSVLKGYGVGIDAVGHRFVNGGPYFKIGRAHV